MTTCMELYNMKGDYMTKKEKLKRKKAIVKNIVIIIIIISVIGSIIFIGNIMLAYMNKKISAGVFAIMIIVTLLVYAFFELGWRTYQSYGEYLDKLIEQEDKKKEYREIKEKYERYMNNR